MDHLRTHYYLKILTVASVIGLTTTIAVWATLKNSGSFAGMDSSTTNILLSWAFITVVSIPTLLLSAAVREHELTKQHLKQLAYYDPLTQLLNRTAFVEKLDHCLQTCRQDNCNLCAIVFININNFKEINDNLGYSIGDQLLKQLGERLEFLKRNDQIIARFGESEFVVLLYDIETRDKATAIAEQILEVLKPPFTLQTYEYTITTSIGIAYIDDPHQSSKELVRNANLAMADAQDQQVNYVEFTPLINARLSSYITLKQQLNQAIAKQEFELRYQPVVDLESEQILGFEALLRWNNAEQGLVSPAKFIPLAEETGFICEIGDWVMDQACHQLQQWQQQFSSLITINVNLSPKQLHQKNLVQNVQTIIENYDIAPTRLKLEITETAIFDLSNYQVLQQFKAMGLGLYIDDFGVGYSSLSRLHRLPFDGIKIDRSFIEGISNNRCKIAVIQTILSLANTLQFNVIGEGIETQLQQTQLLAWGCFKGQGFRFGKPLTADVATQLLQQQESNIKS